jgi:deoxyribodipyrimidine photolyase
MYYFPFTRDKEFQEKRQNLIRDNDYQLFEAWKEGMT